MMFGLSFEKYLFLYQSSPLNLNKQKDKLKKMGIKVDGKHYRIRFKGTGSEKNFKIGDTYLCTLKIYFSFRTIFS